MKLQLEHHVDKLYKNIDSKTRNHFKESLNENYLNTAFELQKGIGIGEKMEIPYDERKLENILRTPWASDGKNFSQRIWKDRTQLVNNLQRNLSESVIRGESDTEMIQALSKDEDRAEFNTRRLIETESAYFDSLSEQECCEDFGVEKYRFLAVLDMKTSDICQELDNKVFLEKDRQVGVNAPPMHPFCRSTTAPVIDEDFLTSRRAKNPKTGEYDEIPADMNYKQWKEKYVEGKENAEEVKQEQVKADTPNGNSTNDSSSKQNQTIEEFDSKEFRKNYDNRVINKSDVQEPATIELDNPVSYGNTEKVYRPVELQEKQEEVIKANKALLEKVENNKDNLPEGLVKDIKSTIKKNKELNEAFNELSNRNLNKNIELPNELINAKEIPEDIKLEIKSGIEELQKEYNIKLDIIDYEDISYEFGKCPMQFAPITIKGIFKTRLVINKGYDWNDNLEEYNDRIYNRNFLKRLLASRNVKDLVNHEMAHVMTFQDCQSWEDYKKKEKDVRNQYIKGISNYNTNSYDGAETIAEGFVALKNGAIEVPEKIKKLVEYYINRYKKR